MNKLNNQIQKRNIYTKHDAGAVFLSAVAVPQVVGVIFVIILMCISALAKIQYDTLTSNPVVLTVLTATSQLCFFAIFFVYNFFAKVNFKRANKINFKFGILSLIVAIVIGLIALFGYNNIITCFDELLKLLGHESASMPLPLNTPLWLIVNIVVLAIFPAVFEELLFRGVILNGLKQYGKWIAILVSAALFSLIHGSIDQLIYPFILGIILAFIADTTNSVVPTIIVHFINNCTVIVINYISNITGFTFFSNINLRFILGSLMIAIGATGIIIVLMILLNYLKKKRISKTTNSVSDNKIQVEEVEYYLASQKKPNILLWIGIGIGALVWIMSLMT